MRTARVAKTAHPAPAHREFFKRHSEPFPARNIATHAWRLFRHLSSDRSRKPLSDAISLVIWDDQTTCDMHPERAGTVRRIIYHFVHAFSLPAYLHGTSTTTTWEEFFSEDIYEWLEGAVLQGLPMNDVSDDADTSAKVNAESIDEMIALIVVTLLDAFFAWIDSMHPLNA